MWTSLPNLFLEYALNTRFIINPENLRHRHLLVRWQGTLPTQESQKVAQSSRIIGGEGNKLHAKLFIRRPPHGRDTYLDRCLIGGQEDQHPR
jgi:hypothetical protein